MSTVQQLTQQPDRVVKFYPAKGQRGDKAGISSMVILLALVHPQKAFAIATEIHTGWTLPWISLQMENIRLPEPFSMGTSLHRQAMSTPNSRHTTECDLVGTCHREMLSATIGTRIMKAFVENGDDGV